MRHLLLAACLVGLSLGLPTIGMAQSAPDCGIICNITTYLASDHMAAEPDGAAATPAKSHRAHAASRRQIHPATAKVATADVPKPTPAIKPKPAGAAKVAAKATTAPAKVEAPHRMVAKVAKPAPSHVVVAAARPHDMPRRDIPARVRVAKSTRAAPAPASRVSAANPPPLGQQTALANIPGSAPTIQAGFQPFGASSFH